MAAALRLEELPQSGLLGQYRTACEAHPGVLIGIRVGEFYEFYAEQAEEVATALNITLTQRRVDARDDSSPFVAMSGVPHHAVERFLAVLLNAGKRVALCEQMEDPKASKGLVRREVQQVREPKPEFFSRCCGETAVEVTLSGIPGEMTGYCSGCQMQATFESDEEVANV